MADETWQERQKRLIAKQRAAQKKVNAAGNGIGVPAADSGPLQSYTRGQTLDYIAQMRNVVENGTLLPNAGKNGLTIDEGTVRQPASDSIIADYTERIATLTAAGNYTDEELAEADARLAANLADGVTLDPGTAAATAE